VSESSLIPDETVSEEGVLRNQANVQTPDEALSKAMIAELPSAILSDMDRDELIRVIRGAELPLIDARTRGRLIDLDRTRLERLAHAARRCCQNQGY